MKRTRMMTVVRNVALLPLGLLACGGAVPAAEVAQAPERPAPEAKKPEPLLARQTPDAPFRQEEPQAGPPVTFVPPKIELLALKNGVKVMLVERHDLPIVATTLVIKKGAGDTSAPPGVMSFMGALLEQGTKKRSALEVSDAYEALGANHAAWASWDAAGAGFKVTTSRFDAALDLLREVVTEPTFPDAEIERLRGRRLTGIQQEKNSVQAMAANTIAAALYGRKHPYGWALHGREAEVKAVGRAQIVKAYDETFVPELAAIVVAGDVTKDALLPKLQKAFGGWKGKKKAGLTRVPEPQKGADATRLVLVDKPGAPQSQVFLVEPGVSFSTPDRDALTVMNTILGGQFSSRINMNLREKNAYTYGAGSRFSMRHGAGPFSAGGAILGEKTAAAIGELFREIEDMRATEPKPEELEAAKNQIALAMPGRFETVSAIVDAVSDLFIYDLPLDEYEKRPGRIQAVTGADVLRVAKKHLEPKTMRVVVVGDRQKLSAQLETLHLGTPELRDAYGDPLGNTAEKQP